MKELQYIRYLLHLILALVIYLVTTLFSKFLFKVDIDGIIIFYMIAQIILFKQLKLKVKNINLLSILIYCALVLTAIGLGGMKVLTENLILLGVQAILIKYYDTKVFSHYYYLTLFKVIFGILVVTSLFHFLVPAELSKFLSVFYIFIITLFTVLLRWARNYEYKITSKHERFKIVGIIGAILLICNKTMYLFIFSTLGKLAVVIIFVIGGIFMVIMYPITKIMPKIDIFNMLGKMSGNMGNNNEDVIIQNSTLSPQIGNIIQVMVIIAIIGAVLFFIMIVRNDEFKDEEEGTNETILRERLTGGIQKNKRQQSSLYKSNDNRTIIKKLFYDIQCRLKKKAVYCPADTATEVVFKVKKDNSKEISKINKIYNKAKFSRVEITDEEIESARTEYLKIKSSIKHM